MIQIYNEETIQHKFFTSKMFNQNIERHIHFFWEITYCVDGEVTHWINEKPIKMHACSEIIIIKPSATHRITQQANPLNSAPAFHRDIYVTAKKMKQCCNFLSPTLYKELLEQDCIVLDGKKENLEALEYSLKIFENYDTFLKRDNELLEKIHTAVVFQILSIYFKKFLQKPQYPAWINDFFANLKNEAYLCQSVEDITKGLNYSHAYLSREFKKHTGKTMVQCLNESRIVYSTLLLLDPKNTILMIAMRLNYNSQSAYCNAFKKMYNMSPREWQKTQLHN